MPAGRGGRGGRGLGPPPSASAAGSSAQHAAQADPPAAPPSPPQAAEQQAARPQTLADIGDRLSSRRNDPSESTIGGETTCIVCMARPKSHLAAPCGHLCSCSFCADKMNKCPICRQPVAMWVKVHVA